MKLVILMLLLPAIITATGNNKRDWNHFAHRMLRHYSQIKNKQSNEKCVDVDFPMKDDSKVNVLAFLDPTWPLSGRQMSKLLTLVHRLEEKKIPETSFFVVIKYTHLRQENDNTFVDELKKTIPDNIKIVEDDLKLQIWPKMKASRNQVLVLDHCGKLMYRFIVSRGIPRLSHLQSAISSAHTKPCGKCIRNLAALDPSLESTPSAKVVVKHAISNKESAILQKKNDEKPIDSTPAGRNSAENSTALVSESSYPNFGTLLSQNGGGGKLLRQFKKIPLKLKMEDEEAKEENKEIEEMYKKYEPMDLKIIMRAPHYHGTKDPKSKYDYMVFDLDDPNYHGHMNDYSANSAEVNNNFDLLNHPQRADVNDILFDEDFNDKDINYGDEVFGNWDRISVGPYDNKDHATKKRKLDDYLNYEE